MTDATDWAGPHSALYDELLLDGFDLVVNTEDQKYFGNRLIQLRRSATQLRVVRDRSQWSLEIAGPGGIEWFSPAVWRALVEGDLGRLDVLTPAEEDAFIRDNLWRIERCIADNEGVTLVLLREWRARRAAARRARPSEWPPGARSL